MKFPHESPTHPAFHGLTPERILHTVEAALGIACTNLCRPYNSYINRVYQIESRDGLGLVVKFYRPGRWSREALQDEHDFLLELAAEEMPVIAPLPLCHGGTLGTDGDLSFAVFPRKGDRDYCGAGGVYLRQRPAARGPCRYLSADHPADHRHHRAVVCRP